MCDCPQHAGERITLEDIEAARTPRGGWTRQQIEAWGLTWPPRKGWKNRLIYGEPDFPARPACQYCHDHGLIHDQQFGEGGYHYREANARLDLANERRCFMRDISDADVRQRMKEDRR